MRGDRGGPKGAAGKFFNADSGVNSRRDSDKRHSDFRRDALPGKRGRGRFFLRRQINLLRDNLSIDFRRLK